MNTKTKSILSLGLIYGLILIVLNLIPYVFNLSQSKILGYVNIVVVIASLFIIQRQYKKRVYNNRITYGKLLSGSLLILLVALVFTTAYTYAYYTVIAPEQIDELKNLTYIELSERGISDSQLDMQISIMDKYFTAKSLTISVLFSNLLTGFIVVLILGVINKSKSNSLYNEVFEEKSSNS